MDLPNLAGAIGQPARIAMLMALMGGEWLSATELARRAGVSRPTASEHIRRLLEAGLITRQTRGRRREHALAGPDVAEALEALARIGSRTALPARVAGVAGGVAGGVAAGRPGAGGPAASDLRFARTCYDHLAGALGVRVTEALVERGLVAPTGADITPAGAAWLGTLGLDPDALRRRRRSFVRFCLDWSERRDHLAGAVGAALTQVMLERRWIARLPDTRAVRLTARGRDGLCQALDLEF